MVSFGGSEFVNCSVPLAFGGRCFILESGPPNTLVKVRPVNTRDLMVVPTEVTIWRYLSLS